MNFQYIKPRIKPIYPVYQLNDEFCKIPEEYRYIGLEDSQALVYYRDSASFIELGGMI